MNAAQDRRRGSEVDVLLAGFGEWLDAERGLAGESVRCYRSQVRTFLASLPEPLEGALAELDAAAVTRFVLESSAASNSVWSAKAQLTALRSLLAVLTRAGVDSGAAGRGRAWRGRVAVGQPAEVFAARACRCSSGRSRRWHPGRCS